MRALSAIAVALAAAATSAFAHHSNSAFDPDKVVVFSPHSDQLSVQERIRFTAPGILEDRLSATDPKALLEPFTQVRTYRKASPPNDELREFSCAEGLLSVK